MLELINFLDGLARATPIFLTVAGLLLYIFREKFKQILARSLSTDLESLRREIAKDLAEHASQLQRELEAYKVSLIAESERVKAAQEVKKSLALRIAERKFLAVAKLLDAHAGLGIDVGSHVCGPAPPDPQLATQMFLDSGREVLLRLKALSTAMSEASPFLDLPTKRLIIESQAAMSTALSLRPDPHSQHPALDGPEMQRVFETGLVAEEALRKVMAALESLD